jgi:hypothetical protein
MLQLFLFLPDLKTAFSILTYLIKPGTIYGIKTFYNYKTGNAILSYLLRNIVNGVPIKCFLFDYIEHHTLYLLACSLYIFNAYLQRIEL